MTAKWKTVAHQRTRHAGVGWDSQLGATFWVIIFTQFQDHKSTIFCLCSSLYPYNLFIITISQGANEQQDSTGNILEQTQAPNSYGCQFLSEVFIYLFMLFSPNSSNFRTNTFSPSFSMDLSKSKLRVWVFLLKILDKLRLLMGESSISFLYWKVTKTY